VATPPIAHFGTTIASREALECTDRFLELFGMERLFTNDYGEAMGLQWIYRRGGQSDVDYLEKDSFFSPSSSLAPPLDAPRVAETVFRLPHREPDAVWAAWCREGLVEAIRGDGPTRLFVGPDAQTYELTATSDDPVENHRIWVWTDPAELEGIEADFSACFDLVAKERAVDFHGLGEAVVLVRGEPAVSIGLVTPFAGAAIAPRWTDDVFAQVGYSHFRLGAPDRSVVARVGREAYPDTGDVSYVHFHHTYLELVEVH